MSAISLTISAPLDEVARDALRDVSTMVERFGIDYVLIGAKARDLILHHHYGAPVRRATADIDFAIYVQGWEEFQRIHTALLHKGYHQGHAPHELRSTQGCIVDIIPFGGVADADATIGWPPEGTIEMSVMGFNEACSTAYRVYLPGQAPLEIKVANLESQALLKLVAWTERIPDTRRKDAADIAYLFQNYSRVDWDRGTLYEGKWAAVLEENGYDATLTAMQLLGARARLIAAPGTLAHVLALLNDGLPRLALEDLATDMSRSVTESVDECLRWLATFKRGLQDQ
ncbi:nucleotidyl transferase AbiEii/AbiGii toxin family protein [Modicisalibacter radicis]|uniref:nucleotidyl transferase AbiEii/AbiGii toxin family protein n=1 Tax=Halomonas sp. EAR18 TaxID=2518972 RepID=UPI00144478DB|nr:nucleotidyl transferase AbiEii/AbiGii toxin family protein [Halomonas sp. EAR18]